MGDAAGPHRSPLEALGLPPGVVVPLARYLDVLAAWSPRVNLTAARTPLDRVRLLVAPVVPAAAVPAPGQLIDIGSGNGSPGLVLALLRPDLQVTLLEPRQKRWAFLREVARAVGRGDLDVRRERHDTYGGPTAATVTLRALALSLPELAPLVQAGEGGRVVVFGSAPRDTAGWCLEATAAGPFQVWRRQRST